MSEHSDASPLEGGPTDGSSDDATPADFAVEPSYRLLRAIEELRELERERRTVPATDAEFDALARRVEEKAREVFQIAEGADDVDPLGSL